MTIADQITRLNNAKAAIKQSLANKGVEVSDSALLDEYPALIDSIEVGSGEGGNPLYEAHWNLKTKNNTNYASLFSGYTGIELDVSNLDTNKVTNMEAMFNNCKLLTSLDVSNFDTSKVTKMSNMFFNCYKLTTLDVSNFDTSKVTNMDNMLQLCTALHTLRLDNCSKATINKIITSYGFPTDAISGVTRTIYCKKSNVIGLKAPTNWVFSYVYEEEPEVPVDPPVEDITLYVPGEFQDNTEVTEVRTIVDESHDDLSNMFAYCTNLVSVNTEDWDTSNVTNMMNMFDNCESITQLNVSNWDTSNVTDMSSMFQGCTSLTQLDLSNFNTALVWSMGSMFYECTSLTTLNLSNWDTSSIFMPDMDMLGMFDGCTSLHTLRLDNCSNDTIKAIIRSSQFPTNAISGVTRTIYCKESEAAGLTAPTNWTFSYVD